MDYRAEITVQVSEREYYSGSGVVRKQFTLIAPFGVLAVTEIGTAVDKLFTEALYEVRMENDE